jgi:hypothetical protein
MKNRLLVILLLIFTINEYAQYGPSPAFFRTQRAAPLVILNTTQTISVVDYGAIVNDGIDDLVAIQNAIQASVSIGTLLNPVRLEFENGTYDLKPTSGSHALSMTDANYVLWDGQNAEFLNHNPTVGFLSLLRCSNTIIKDFSIDYATLPFTQGVITKVDVANGFFEFRVDDGFPLPVDSHFRDAPERWGMIKNLNGGIKKGTKNLIPHISSFKSIDKRTYEYADQTGNLSGVAVGDYFVHMARYNGKTIIVNNAGKNLTYLNITAFSGPAGGFNAFNSDSWHVLDCKIKFKETRKHTLNADAMHINGGKIGPWVENSLFEGFADDCMNLKYTQREIKEINSSTELTVQGNVIVDENMEFYNPRDGVFLGTATVNAVQNLGGNQYRITLSNPINITNIADHQLADKAYIESRSNESFIFRNNIVRNNRRHGLLIQSKYALIENNLFQNQSTSGIALENGVDWGEGFRTHEIEIKNNTFENCGSDTEYISDSRSAAILVDFQKLGTPCTTSTNWCGTQTTNFQGHSNIRILDNRITYNKRGLYLKNINGLVVKNNFICHNDGDISLAQNETPITQTLLNNSGVTVEDYNFVVPNANLQFKLNENTANSTIVNTGSNSTIDLKIYNTGGEITQGFTDNEVGFVLNINTAGNGQLRFINKADDSPFPGPTGGAARSYSFWIKPEEAIFQTLLFSGGPTAGEVFAVQMQANRVLRVSDNNQNFISMADMPLDIGVWNHITIAMPENGKMSSISLYKNGIASREMLSGSDVSINTASNRIDFFTTFKGLASDIRFFETNLCGGEVESIYNDRQSTNSTSTDIYVSASGNDTTGDGTSQKPYFTINKAVLEVGDGNKIIIVGSITETLETTIANKNITFEGQSNAIVTRSNTGRLINITGTSTVSFSNITFENCNAGVQGVVVNAAIGNKVTFTDCLFQNNVGTAQNGSTVHIASADATFTRCTFYNNSATASNGRGAAIIFGGTFSGEITNCTFFKNKLTENITNNIGATIVTFVIPTGGDPATQQLTITNSLFLDNTNKNGDKVDIQYPSQNLSILNTLAERTNIAATNNTITNSNLTVNFTNTTFNFVSPNVTFNAPNLLADSTPIDYGTDNNDAGAWDSKITLFKRTNTLDWGTATNWSGAIVPTAADNVVLLSDSGHLVISSTTQAVSNDLFVNTPSSLTINSGGSLIVSGTSTGNVTYKRILTAFAGNSNGWHLVTSPLAGETFDIDWASSNEIATGSNANLGVATYNTTGIPSKWAYLQSPNGSTASTSGIGYSMKRSTTGTVSFTGTINTNDVNGRSISATDNGFNLLGNPYTAFMSSETFLADNLNLNQNQIWTWTHSNGYRARIKASDFILSPGQGFFVQATSGSTVNFAESNQYSGADNFQKSSKSEINLFVRDAEITRGAELLYFDNNVTTDFDNGFEGELFAGVSHALAIYSDLLSGSNGKKYQVQSLPKADMEQMIVTLGVIAEQGKEITFTAEALNLPTDVKVYLEDRVTNTITRLDEANSSYKVTLNDALNGTGRFYLQTKTSGVLSTNDIVLKNINVFSTNINTLKIVGLPYGNTKIKLSNLLGKQLMQTSFNSTGMKEITIPKLATGMYIFQIETGSGNLTKKLVLE